MTDEEFNRIQWAVQGREGVGQGSEKRAVTAQRGRSMTRKQRIKVRQMCPFLIRGGATWLSLLTRRWTVRSAEITVRY